jgi:hypothetical protein
MYEKLWTLPIAGVLDTDEAEWSLRAIQKSKVYGLRRILSAAEQTSASLLSFSRRKHLDRLDFISVISLEPIEHLLRVRQKGRRPGHPEQWAKNCNGALISDASL